MKILLDTRTFLWLAEGAPNLSPMARQIFLGPENQFYFSSISVAEICIKVANSKLHLDVPPQQLIEFEQNKNGLLYLPLFPSDAFLLASLPRFHKDPFDRMLICQALTHDLTLLTPDPLVRQYAVPTLW